MTNALIYGTDAVTVPDPVDLPTDVDNWFTQGNGTTINGTQVPSYWANKVGAELGNAIFALWPLIGGTPTIDMTNRGQLGFLLALLLQNVQTITPKTGRNPVSAPAASTPYELQITMTAPCAGYVKAAGSLNMSNNTGGNIALNLALSGSGVTAETNTFDTVNASQTQYAQATCAAGADITFTMTATTGSTPPSVDFTLAGLLEFVPSPVA